MSRLSSLLLRTLAAAAFASTALAAAGASPAHATGSISIDEGTSFSESGAITVRYKGYQLYERFFVQQCWQGPGPEFDFSVSCHPETMVFPGLIDRDEGTVTFQLFVGDDPFGAFPVSCGPKTDPSYVQFDTCYIRAVTYSRERNDLAVFVPITFEGAKPATTTTTVPVTLAPTGSIAAEPAPATTSTVPAAPAPGATTSAAGPTMSATTSGSSGGRSPFRTALVAAGFAGVVVLAVRAWSRKRAALASG